MSIRQHDAWTELTWDGGRHHPFRHQHQVWGFTLALSVNSFGGYFTIR